MIVLRLSNTFYTYYSHVRKKTIGLGVKEMNDYANEVVSRVNKKKFPLAQVKKIKEIHDIKINASLRIRFMSRNKHVHILIDSQIFFLLYRYLW